MDLLQVEQGVKESGKKQENSNKNGEISGEISKEVVMVGENLSQEIQISEVVMKSTYSTNVDKNCSITNTEDIGDNGSKNNEGDSTKITGEDEMAGNDLKHGNSRPELMTMSTYSAIADKNCSVIIAEAIGEVGVNNNEGDSDEKRTGEDNEEGDEEVQTKQRTLNQMKGRFGGGMLTSPEATNVKLLELSPLNNIEDCMSTEGKKNNEQELYGLDTSENEDEPAETEGGKEMQDKHEAGPQVSTPI